MCDIFSVKVFFFYVFKNAGAFCPTRTLDGARCLFASGSSHCFVLFLASGGAGDDDVADDDAGVAPGLGMCSPVTVDLDLPRGA